MTAKVVHVAVGVIARNNQILLAKRADHQHQGGLWEFPGGKVEAGEPVEVALGRELKEELGIEVNACEPLLQIRYDYPDKSVLLDVWLINGFDGEPVGVEGQPLIWCAVADLSAYDFPKANIEIVSFIQNKFGVVTD